MKYKETIDKLGKAVKSINITMPMAIIIGAVIFSFSFYLVQKNKSDSIEQQNRINTILDMEKRNLQVKRDECESLSAGVKKQWSNVVGVTYDEVLWEECVVTYIDTESGETEKAPLRFMKTNN